MNANASESAGTSDSRGLESSRQSTIERLTEAFASDLISMEEYELRATQANAAKSLVELERISFDLPARKPGPQAGIRDERMASKRSTGTVSSIVGAQPVTTGCVMGDRHLTGNWLTSDRVSSFTVMGSTRLDLRDVELPAGPVHIEAFTVMGDTRIIVPRGLPVRLNTFVFMGESTAGREVNQQVRGAETWIEVSGFIVMGSVKVQAMD